MSVRQWMEKAMAPHSSILACKIPWMEEPGGLQSMGSLRVRHDWATSLSFHFHALEKEMASHSSVLAWRIPGTGDPGGLPSLGSHRVGHDWSNLAAVAAGSEWPLSLFRINFPEKFQVSEQDQTMTLQFYLFFIESPIQCPGQTSPKLQLQG